LLEHPRPRELYPAFLAACYDVSRTMVPLMEAALERAGKLAPGDRVAAGLAEYLDRHIPEETHGGEPGRGTLADLEAIGIDAADVQGRLPSPKLAALVGAQYFWIFHCHPVAILGYLELEAYHPRRATVERLIEKTGLPREGFGQLLLHAEVDVAHAEEINRVLDSLPLEPQHEQLIGLSALQTMALLTEALFEVLDEGQSHRRAASAKPKGSAAADQLGSTSPSLTSERSLVPAALRTRWEPPVIEGSD
jgi:hypothetical protein